MYEVVEVYLVYPDHVELAKMVWRGFGAGLPSSTEDLQHLRYRYVNGSLAVEGAPLGTGVLIQVKHMVGPKVLVDHREAYPREYVAARAGVAVSLLELALDLVRGRPHQGGPASIASLRPYFPELTS